MLNNYLRAAQSGRETIFVVKQGNARKLENILSDPVNRRGDRHEDEQGGFSYYTDRDEPFTDIQALEEGEYRIFEITDDQLEEHTLMDEAECPELDEFSQEELEQFCMHRDQDGFCTALGEQCVFIE